MIFVGRGLQLGSTFVVGQFGTADTMGTGIPQGFYTESYRSTDLELPQRKFKGPYSARIATLRLGPLTAGLAVVNLADTGPMHGE